MDRVPRPRAAAVLLAAVLAATPAASVAAQSSSPTPAAPQTPGASAVSGPAATLLGWLQRVLARLEELPAAVTVPQADEVLECDLEPSDGSGPDEWPGSVAVSRPREALRVALADGWLVPRRGYRVLARAAAAVLYGYLAGDHVKVSVRVVHVPGSGWLPEQLATCRPAEFGPRARMGPGVWLWSNARGRSILERRLSVDCGWGSAHVILWRRPSDPQLARFERWYVRDPEGVFRDQWRGPYLRRTRVPANARDTGYRRGRARIWMASDGGAIYVGRPRDAERWPRVEGAGCG